jgi:hypothetical protein
MLHGLSRTYVQICAGNRPAKIGETGWNTGTAGRNQIGRHLAHGPELSLENSIKKQGANF